MKASTLIGVLALATLFTPAAPKKIHGHLKTLRSVAFLTKFVFVPNEEGRTDGQTYYTFIYNTTARLSMPVFFFGDEYEKAQKSGGCTEFVNFARTHNNVFDIWKDYPNRTLRPDGRYVEGKRERKRERERERRERERESE